MEEKRIAANKVISVIFHQSKSIIDGHYRNIVRAKYSVYKV